jgi:hypothetical protein
MSGGNGVIETMHPLTSRPCNCRDCYLWPQTPAPLHTGPESPTVLLPSRVRTPQAMATNIWDLYIRPSVRGRCISGCVYRKELAR